MKKEIQKKFINEGKTFIRPFSNNIYVFVYRNNNN